jgi:cell fate (sporulation/competence/biofilm development) regulator YmcA (YheA/YmcA/DUF963 family)
MHHELIKWHWEEHKLLETNHPSKIKHALEGKQLERGDLLDQMQREKLSHSPEDNETGVSLNLLEGRINKVEKEQDELRRVLAHYPNYYVIDDKGYCQCTTERAIGYSREPDRMRAFLMIAVLIDQMMWTHFRYFYGEFLAAGFRFPKLNSHVGGGMASPSWFCLPYHGFDKKVNWEAVRDVAEILLNGLYSWFDQIGQAERKRGFQQILGDVVKVQGYGPINSERLIPIVSKLVKPSGNYQSNFYKLFLIRNNRERLWVLESRLLELGEPVKAKQKRNLLRKQKREAHLLRNAFRKNLIQELSGLTIIEQLRRVADDQNHVVQFYPTSIADRATTDVIKQLDQETRAKLIQKMSGRHKGPWSRFKCRLMTVH